MTVVPPAEIGTYEAGIEQLEQQKGVLRQNYEDTIRTKVLTHSQKSELLSILRSNVNRLGEEQTRLGQLRQDFMQKRAQSGQKAPKLQKTTITDTTTSYYIETPYGGVSIAPSLVDKYKPGITTRKKQDLFSLSTQKQYTPFKKSSKKIYKPYIPPRFKAPKETAIFETQPKIDFLKIKYKDGSPAFVDTSKFTVMTQYKEPTKTEALRYLSESFYQARVQKKLYPKKTYSKTEDEIKAALRVPVLFAGAAAASAALTGISLGKDVYDVGKSVAEMKREPGKPLETIAKTALVSGLWETVKRPDKALIHAATHPAETTGQLVLFKGVGKAASAISTKIKPRKAETMAKVKGVELGVEQNGLKSQLDGIIGKSDVHTKMGKYAVRTKTKFKAIGKDAQAFVVGESKGKIFKKTGEEWTPVKDIKDLSAAGVKKIAEIDDIILSKSKGIPTHKGVQLSKKIFESDFYVGYLSKFREKFKGIEVGGITDATIKKLIQKTDFGKQKLIKKAEQITKIKDKPFEYLRPKIIKSKWEIQKELLSADIKDLTKRQKKILKKKGLLTEGQKTVKWMETVKKDYALQMKLLKESAEMPKPTRIKPVLEKIFEHDMALSKLFESIKKTKKPMIETFETLKKKGIIKDIKPKKTDTIIKDASGTLRILKTKTKQQTKATLDTMNKLQQDIIRKNAETLNRLSEKSISTKTSIFSAIGLAMPKIKTKPVLSIVEKPKTKTTQVLKPVLIQTYKQQQKETTKLINRITAAPKIAQVMKTKLKITPIIKPVTTQKIIQRLTQRTRPVTPRIKRPIKKPKPIFRFSPTTKPFRIPPMFFTGTSKTKKQLKKKAKGFGYYEIKRKIRPIK